MSLIAGHHDLDLDVLDQLSVGGRDVALQVVLSRTGPNGAVVLATCNRYEVYLEAADEKAVEQAARQVTESVAAASGLDPDEVSTHLHVLTGEDVAAHLFAVAAGLDSMVVGEQEISGQVRRALTAAREAGTTSSGLERMFQYASRSARAVANETGLGAAGRSLVGIALGLAGERLASTWADTRVVLVGTGSYAGASLAALRNRGALDVRVYSPSGRAVAFATARGIDFLEESELYDAVAVADLIVACSGAAGPVFDVDRLRAIRQEAATGAPRQLVVVDLALRHDVDPHVADLPGVHLITLDTVAQHSPGHHSGPVDHAQGIIDTAVTSFMADQRAREWSAEIVAARDKALAAAEANLRQWLDSVGALDEQAREVGALDDQDRVVVAFDDQDRVVVAFDEQVRERAVRARRRAARALVHGPTVRARAAAQAGDLPTFRAALDELRRLAEPSS
jgi:glutamyl-tRNA reductase